MTGGRGTSRSGRAFADDFDRLCPRPMPRRTRHAVRLALLVVVTTALWQAAGAFGAGSWARALGTNDGIEVRRVRVGNQGEDPRPKAAQRIAWEIRKRTSIETTLDPSVTRFDDPSVYRTPLLYWASDRAFEP